MRIGDILVHNGITAELVEELVEDDCQGCCFNIRNRANCVPEDIHCDGGIFKAVKHDQPQIRKEEVNE